MFIIAIAKIKVNRIDKQVDNIVINGSYTVLKITIRVIYNDIMKHKSIWNEAI